MFLCIMSPRGKKSINAVTEDESVLSQKYLLLLPSKYEPVDRKYVSFVDK